MDREDISDKILIAPIVVAVWATFVKAAVDVWITQNGYTEEMNVSDEIVTMNDDGETLTVSATLNETEMSMDIEAGHWSWRQ